MTIGQKVLCFISCFCGGFSACAHQAGHGSTIQDAERAAAEKWNCRAEQAKGGGNGG